jgi:hypothetical protein
MTNNRLSVAAPTPIGIEPAWRNRGTVTGAAFIAYAKHMLAPSLRPGQTTVLDVLSRAYASRLIPTRNALVVPLIVHVHVHVHVHIVIVCHRALPFLDVPAPSELAQWLFLRGHQRRPSLVDSPIM